MYIDEQGSEPTLLIVDDDIIQKTILKKPLSRLNIHTIFAFSGPECIDILKRKNNIKLILLDIMMPEINGFQTLSAIRTFNTDVPIISMSASATENDIEKLLGHGFAESILKPISANKIKEVFDLYNNERSVFDETTEQENSDSALLLKHLTTTQEQLEVCYARQDISLLKLTLHQLRENALCATFDALVSQIKILQEDIVSNQINSIKIQELNNFLSHFIKGQYLVLNNA